METYVISDHHFGHSNALTFKKADGSPLGEFSCSEEMDEHMVEQHNKVVRPNDKCIFLGDLVINKKFLPILNRLNGKKRLVFGNHDIFGYQEYSKYFYEMSGYRVFDRCIFSHIPVHRESIGRFAANIQGHLHSNVVLDNNGVPDINYICMCVEQPHVNYTPVPWYRVKEILKERGVNFEKATDKQ